MAYQRSQQHGGDGGSPFSDDLTETVAIVEMTVRHGSYVDSIETTWKLVNGTTHTGARHGGTGGSANTFTLESGEYINSIAGRSGSYIDQLSFSTNRGHTFGPYGGDGGSPFVINVGEEFGGFFGRSGSYLDAFGAFYPHK